MALKKGGLGRGLDALLSENSTEDGAKTVTLRLLDIAPNPDQPRRSFDDEALSELASSIEKHGVLQPLLVRPMPDGHYQIVAGERRFRAAKLAGLTDVPVVIRDLSDRETAELALIENLQREDLNPLEEAMGYRTLMEQYGLTQEETASAVGKSRPAVANALRLLSLPQSVADMVASGTLSAGHARALLPLGNEKQQLSLAKEITAKDLSVRETERLVKTLLTPVQPTVTRRFKARFQDEVALSLSEQMGRKVQVAPGKKGGKLVIEYFDEDDLRSLAKTLAGD
ncbi:MAG: ParB/RepB/Spo0J family partition protein [Clostridia bacterium]|nr:ParB/RepB/Spo0J family partition protein [Clostridia bacterium]